jgi:sialate O-acetylesterase
MGLQVSQALNASEEIANAASHGGPSGLLRIMQVATPPSYGNVTAPQRDLSLSVKWGRASPDNVPYMSASCFYYAVSRLQMTSSSSSSGGGGSGDATHHVGMIASAWGGTAIQVWMAPPALKSCGVVQPAEEEGEGHPSTPRSIQPQLLPATPTSPEALASGTPTLPSPLWNRMIAPRARWLRLSGWLWYQGESNAGNPELHRCLFPAMIQQWRQSFRATPQQQQPLPFVFVQVSAWPTNDFGVVTGMRHSQDISGHTVPAVGMAVAADIGDPAGAYHPIHPAFKQEVGRRLAVTMSRIQLRQMSSQPHLKSEQLRPAEGPRVVSAGKKCFRNGF